MKSHLAFLLTLVSCALLATAAGADTAQPASDDLEALEIELPRPTYNSTPVTYRGENLEERPGKPRPPFLAPKGTGVVSRGVNVTSSERPQRGSLDMAVDADKEAYEFSVLELPSGRQWIQLDLGREYELYAILVWHFFAYERVYFDVIVQASNDPEFREAVTTLFNNDHDNSAGLGVGKDKEYVETHEGRLIDAQGVTARYVRLYSSGNTTDDASHYSEIEVYGKSPAA